MKCDTARGNIFNVAGKQIVARGGVWAGVVCARNGDLVVAFGTTSDGVWGGRVMVTRSTDGGTTWSAPGNLVESQWKETGAAGAGSGMATLSDGTILLPFVDVTTPRIPGVPITGPIQTYMDFRGEGNYGRAYVMRSSDNGETWSTPHWIARTGTLTRPHGRILELQDGSVICPVIVYTFYGRKMAHSYSGLVRSLDMGRTWGHVEVVADSDPGYEEELGTRERFNETGVVELPSGRLIALMRVSYIRTQYRTVSDDGGRTWTVPQPNITGKYPNMFISPGGRLVLVQKIIQDNRNMGIRVYTSDDEGVTWQEDVHLESVTGVPESGARPEHAILPDGRIIVFFLDVDPDPDTSHPAWPYTNGVISMNVLEETG